MVACKRVYTAADICCSHDSWISEAINEATTDLVYPRSDSTSRGHKQWMRHKAKYGGSEGQSDLVDLTDIPSSEVMEKQWLAGLPLAQKWMEE